MKIKTLKNWIRIRTVINGLAFVFLVCVGMVMVDAALVAKQTLKKIALEITFIGPENLEYLGEYDTTAYSDRFKETTGKPSIEIIEQTGKGEKKTILRERSDERLFTASGLPVDEETIAVSRDMLRSGEFYYGEKLWVPQLHKSFTVKDKMGLDKYGREIARRLDVFSFNRKYVDSFGLKKLKIYKIR